MYKQQEFNFSTYGAFFAFWKDQFDEKKVDWVKYVDCGLWLVAPANIAHQMMIDFDNHNKNEHKKSLEIDGIDKIIEYQLSNHECYYTRDLEPVQWLIETYWTTQEYIREIFNKTKDKHTD